MTREEKEQTGKYLHQMARLLEDGCYQQEMLLKAVRIIDETLEQESQTFKWCTDCKEYDQGKHCCHRWSKAIRDTVEEMKEEYIEREVLDDLRAEITTLQNRCYALTKGTMCIFCKYECKYKAESEDKKNNNE